MFRTYLGAKGTANAHIFVDTDFFIFKVKGGASNFVDAIPVVLAPALIDIKGTFLFMARKTPGIKRADFP